ncbi:MAG TPA: hypothetical protein VGO67_20550 [Verrucomicrobiae bacterium]
MKDHELERFEADLRRLRPAKLPDQFAERLNGAKPGIEAVSRTEKVSESSRPGLWRLLWWVAPALAAVAVGLIVVRHDMRREIPSKKPVAAASSATKPDEVQLDQELVSTFDVVAKLPGGEPVRFRCRKWNDQLVVTDTNRGIEIVQNSPRMEVVPVRFETY